MLSEVFWAKIFFRDFLEHYIDMTDEQIVKDVKDSIIDLVKLSKDGKSFGSLMVQRATERVEKNRVIGLENGKKGGRPKKLSLLSGPMPESKEEVLDFAMEFGLNEADVINCWYATAIERDNHDKDGNPITDWKAFLITWCKTANKNRNKS